MEYKHEITTICLSGSEYRQTLNDILRLFKQNNLQTIDLLFGYAWGDEYRDWIQFEVAIDSIANEISIAENLGVGKFGHDDLFLTSSIFSTDILFCHETDIHLRYNDENSLVEEILELWKVNNFLLLHEG